MRTTITIDDDLFQEASALCGDASPSGLMTKACKLLVEVEAAHRLMKLSGKAPEFNLPPRSQRAGGHQKVAEKNEPYGS